jgi:iron(III) transport system permease protein
MATAQNSAGRRGAGAARWAWPLAAWAIALVAILPLVSVVWTALNPVENIWPHLIATTLPRYLRNTLILAGGVGLLSAAVGAGSAWLVVIYRFPGSGLVQWLLLLPLAIPAYVGAYALVDFLEYSGIVQTALREAFGWTSARDYWFPQVRSRGAAVVVLAASLYPYVYLLTRAALREQSGAAYEVARSLGTGPLALFWRVGLPLARPAIAAGVAVVMMETVNDFGTVSYFAVQTLTTGIFTTWLEAGNAGGAAQIACLMLALILALVMTEKLGRRRLRFHQGGRAVRPVMPLALTGWRGGLALGLCLVPVAVGFVLPLAVILKHALTQRGGWVDPGLLRAFLHTLTTAGAAALICVAGALVMVYAVRLSRGAVPQVLLPLASIGYAAPGAVLAVGILMPLAALDHRLADLVTWITGQDPGLLLTGSAFAVVLAYSVRFFAIAVGASDAALGRIPPSLPMAARSLGQGAAGTLRRITLPLIRGSVGTALLLVFVDGVKELPATLLLRPFNYDTLATRVHEKASLEQIGQAAPPAILVVAVGLLAVLVLARANLGRRG